MRLVLLNAVLPALAGAQQGTVLVHKSRPHGIEEDALYCDQDLVQLLVWSVLKSCQDVPCLSRLRAPDWPLTAWTVE